MKPVPDDEYIECRQDVSSDDCGCLVVYVYADVVATQEVTLKTTLLIERNGTCVDRL